MSQHLRRAHKLTKPGEIAAAKRAFNRLNMKRSNTEESRPSKKAKPDLLLTQKIELPKSGNTTEAKSKPASSKKKRKKATSEVESESSDDNSSQIKYDDDSADDSLEESDSSHEDDAELWPLTKKEYSCVKDYLLVTALYENGSRPGPLENAKITRLEQAVYSETNKRWMLLVDEHKTTQHQGPAEIVMDERLFSYVKLYVEHLRPWFVASGEDNVFIKDDGQSFRKGTIGRRVGEVFWRAGVWCDVTVTATRIRKLFSFSAAEMSPTEKRAINAHMKHKESTADSNYVLKVNTDKASATHALMREIIDQPSAAAKQKEVERKSALPLPTTGSSSDTDDEVPLGKILGLPGAGSGADAKLDAGDKVVIRSVFKNEMEAGQLLSRHQVRTKMRNDKHLRQYVVQKKKVKKIADFLRYETNTIRQLF